MKEQLDNSTSHSVKQQLLQLCTQPSIDQQDASAFVAALSSLGQESSKQPTFQSLAADVVELMTDLQPQSTNRHVVTRVLMAMMSTILDNHKCASICVANMLVHPAIRQLIAQTLTEPSQTNPIRDQMKCIFKKALSTDYINKISNLILSRPQLPSSTQLGLMKMLCALLSYLQLIDPADNRQHWFKTMEQCCKSYAKQQAAHLNKEEFDIFLSLCVELENMQRSPTNKWYVPTWVVIMKIFQIARLEKKLLALSCLDAVLPYIRNKPLTQGNPLTAFDLTTFLSLIFEPQNHEEILYRSINFLCFWLQTIDSPQKLDAILNDWFGNLILSSDVRISNIFGSAWQQLIANVDQLGAMQVEKMYQNAIKFYQKSYGIESGQELKVIKILSPLMSKQFKELEKHQSATMQFLKLIWENKNKASKNLQLLLDESMKKCITCAISPQFNLIILAEAKEQLSTIVANHRLNQNDSEVANIEKQITQIYAMITCFMVSLSGNHHDDSATGAVERTKIRQAGIPIVKDRGFITNLIICHNSQNQDQLRQLLQLMTIVIKEVNEGEFEAELLRMIRRKVDSSNEYFIVWMRDRMSSIKNQVLKQTMMKEMFGSPKIYTGVSLAGVEGLLQILLLYEYSLKQKHMFALSLLLDVQTPLVGQFANKIFHTLWSRVQLIKQSWLLYVAPLIGQTKLGDEKQMMVYREIIKIGQEISTCSYESQAERVLCENVALQEKVEVRVRIVGQNVMEKAIECRDSIPFWKFRIHFIYSLLRSTLHNNSPVDQAILAIEYNHKQLNPSDIHLSLRKLSSKYPSSSPAPSIVVKMGNKNYVFVKNIKPSLIYHALCNYYGQHRLTISVSKICAGRNLKHLNNSLIEIASGKNYNVEEMLREETLYVIEKAMERAMSALPSVQTQRLVNELAQFLCEIGVENQQELRIQLQCTHRKLISPNQYFIKKSLQLLKLPSDCNTARTGYQCLSMLLSTELLQHQIISDTQTWISIKPKPKQRPYFTCFGLEALWLYLEDKAVMGSFVQNAKFNEVFYLVHECATFLNQETQSSLSEEELEIYVKILVTGLKIFNKIFMLGLLMDEPNCRIAFITRQPKDLLELEETKKHFSMLSNLENLDKLIKQDCQTKEIFEFAQHYKIRPQIQLEARFMIECILKMLGLVEKFGSSSESANLLMLLYQAGRLACWIICLAGKEEIKVVVDQLINKLKSSSSKQPVSKISKSLLYIFLRKDSQNHSNQLLNGLFAKFHPDYFPFHDLFSECYTNCEDEATLFAINQGLITFLVDAEPEKLNTKNQSLSGILSIINNNLFAFNNQLSQTFQQILIENYLFCEKDLTKAVHPQSRLSVYQSIEACLSRNTEAQNQSIYQTIKKQIKRSMSVGEEVKDNKMGVGLRNLGHLCYMNSLLQLLHSIKPFTLQMDSIKSEYPLLVGLQKLFTQLTFSVKKAISPQELVLSFNPPIDVGLQQDTTQFLISFLDKLEEGETTGQFKKIIRDLFQGQTISHFICQKCRQSKQIIESFYLYNLPIQNESRHFSNLEECLQNAKEPEVIYDVNCENCNAQTKFTKKTQPKSIPDYLFIHLRRLIFDYTNPYVKTKVHSRLEFKDHITINKEKLFLKGVITHSGTGEHGHYYTSIRKEGQDWIVYNDSKVYPLPHNGKEEHWYGRGQATGDYSTNAYVLLYQKENKKNISQSKNHLETTTLRQVELENKSIMTKQLLFGQKYRTDFVNFAFNVAKLTKEPLSKIYEMLALISYPQGQTTTTSPLQYFTPVKQNCTSMDQLIGTIFDNRQHNNLLLLHKNTKLRQFFSFYLQRVFKQSLREMAEGKCKLALVYGCEIVSNCTLLIQEPPNFIHSAQYLKMVGFLIRYFSRSQQFLHRFYQTNFIQQILRLFSSRKLQIEMIYNSQQIQLVEPLLEVLISFLKIIESGQQNVVLKVKEYQQTATFMHKFTSEENGLVELIFMANSNRQYSEILFSSLSMDKDGFKQQLLNIARSYLKNCKSIDANAGMNFSYLLWFLQTQFYSHQSQKLNYCQTILGMVFPASSAPQPLFSLQQRTYFFFTTQLQQGFLEIVSQLLLESLFEPKIKIADLKILINFLKLLLQFVNQSATYVQYLSNLCAPIGLYGDFYAFLMGCLESVTKKIDSGLLSAQCQNYQVERGQLKSIIDRYKQAFKDKRNESQPGFCGSLTKNHGVLIQKQMDSLFVVVEEHENFWAKYHDDGKSMLLQYVDDEYKLKSQYKKQPQLTKVLNPTESEQIEEQGFERNRKTTSLFSEKMQESISFIHSGDIRRRLIFKNVAEDEIEFNIFVICQNIKNKNISLRINLRPNESREVLVEKIWLTKKWGQMRITANGVQQIIREEEEMQSMGMEALGEYLMESDSMK